MPDPITTNWGPGPANTNWGPGPVSTNWGPGLVNTNWGPGSEAKQRVGDQEISTDGQLIEDIKELNSRCDIISREIYAIGGKTQVRKEEVRVKLKLFETYLMPALLYGMEAWKKLSKEEIQHLEKIQGKSLKRMFSLPITTPYFGLIIETGVWPAEQRINYSSLMLYHNIMNSSKDRLVKQIIQ